MRNAVFLSCLLAALWSHLAGERARAQTEDDEVYGGDDYDKYFGGDQSEDGQEGPRTLEEARKEGKSYRIGGTGVHSPSRDVHVVKEGDTLWSISERYFGDPWHWPKLWSYNPEITNPHWIYPMDRIRLSPGAQTDVAIAEGGAVETGTGTGLQERRATAGMLSGTEQAPSVIVPKELLQEPGTIFLRDQAYLDREALQTLGQIIGAHEEQMFLSPSDQVYVRFKRDHQVKAGDTYAVFRRMHDWERNPGEDHAKGVLVRIHGTVVVRSVDADKHIARGVIIEALDPIERGFFVAKVDRRFNLVPPKRNESNVVARVVASARPRELLGYNDIVFLDVGEGHGIQPGNRFFIVRRGDDWQDTIVTDPVHLGNIVPVPPYDPTQLPKEVIGELRVLKVRRHTTIALVTRSDTDVALGDVAEMRAGF